MSSKFDYSNKIIAAPMVRISSLPFRLLSLDYGCDVVYSEELIDYRLLRSKRIYNEMLDTIDFVDDDHTIVFRTCSREKDRLVFQIGTADAQRALKAAKLVEQDVAAIDINMGCPKSFSLKGGMGAALLSEPEKIENILKTLVQNLSIPVSCKIRVLPSLEETMKLVKMIERTGVSAIAVHGRTKDERPQHTNRDDFIRILAESISIPLIANGGSNTIETYDDILKFKERTKANSVMVARAAEVNCSVFRKEGKLSIDEVVQAFLRYCIRYESYITITKYSVQQIIGSLQETPRGKKLLAAQNLKEICSIWNLEEEYLSVTREQFNRFAAKQSLSEKSDQEHESCIMQRAKKARFAAAAMRLPDEEFAQQMCCKFVRKAFKTDAHLPKSTLLRWTTTHLVSIPSYKTVAIDKHFYSICEVNGKKYLNSYLEKNKKCAEQGSAMVACKDLLLIDDRIIKECLNS